MRIVQVNNYGYIRGGSEKVFFDTIDMLEDNGHEVCAFCMNDDNNLKKSNLIGVDINRYEYRAGLINTLSSIKNFFYNKKVKREFEKLIKEFKPDLIHIHIIYGRLTNAIISVANYYKIPVVQSVHEFRLLCPVYTCLDNNRKICLNCARSSTNISCILKKCCKGSLINSVLVAAECKFRDWFFNYQKRISGFIMVSDFIMRKHLEYFPEIKDKCFKLYNSIAPNIYEKYISDDKYDSDRYYLYFGRLSYEKGVITLVDYFAKHPEYKLKIVGTGPLLSQIKQRIIDFSITNVELLGYITGDALYSYVANAYFTIVPSEWYENNPLSVIESLILGTPVIANKIGGLPEIIIDSETGYLYNYKSEGDFDKCMNRARLLTKEKYHEMSLNCRKDAEEKFGNEKYYNNLMKIYETVKNTI